MNSKVRVFNRVTGVEVEDTHHRFVVVDRVGNVIVVNLVFGEHALYFIDGDQDEYYRVEVIE